MEEKYMTIDEVAQHLRISTKTVHRWIEAGRLPYTRLGRRYLIPQSKLRARLEKRGDGLGERA